MIEYDRKLLEEKVRLIKALAHPARLWIVEALREKPLCVREFVAMIGDSFPAISRHLHILKEVGVIDDDKQGKKVYYRLAMPCALEFIACAERCEDYRRIKRRR